MSADQLNSIRDHKVFVKYKTGGIMTHDKKYPTQFTKIIRRPDVLNMTGWSKSTLYNRINQGLFIEPISLGARAVGFVLEESQQITNAMIAGKSQDEIRQLVADLTNNRKNLAA